MGKMFNIRFGKIRFEFWRVTFLKSLFWDGLAVQWKIYHVRIEMRQSLLSFCVEISRSARVPVIGNEIGRLVKIVDLCRK